jgi:hypothetical protein
MCGTSREHVAWHQQVDKPVLTSEGYITQIARLLNLYTVESYTRTWSSRRFADILLPNTLHKYNFQRFSIFTSRIFSIDQTHIQLAQAPTAAVKLPQFPAQSIIGFFAILICAQTDNSS